MHPAAEGKEGRWYKKSTLRCAVAIYVQYYMFSRSICVWLVVRVCVRIRAPPLVNI